MKEPNGYVYLASLSADGADSQQLFEAYLKRESTEREVEKWIAPLKAGALALAEAGVPLKMLGLAYGAAIHGFRWPKTASKRGRPKNPQGLITRVKELRDTGKSWPKIAKAVERETGILRSPDSYRDMLRKKAGKIPI
jgi:hypothetical protein